MSHEPGRYLSAVARFSVRHAVWVVAGWLVVVAGLNLLVPQLEAVTALDSTPIAPADTSASRAIASMDAKFGNGKSNSFAFVVFERDSGLTAEDLGYARTVSVRLRHDPRVSFVQDIVGQRRLLQALTSKDKASLYLQIGVHGATGAPTATAQIDAARKVAARGAPAGLEVAVTGPAASIADMSTSIEHSILRITIATVFLIAVILLLIYRSIPVMFLTLGMIGAALAAARGLVALLGQEGLFNVSTFTTSFVTAVVLGAATDYVVFLVSRFHEQRRQGVPPEQAVIVAGGRVSAVIIGSALTVVLANACMAIADVGIYLTTGPAIAAAVLITLAMALTLTPALMALAATRGFLEPRPAPPSRRWAAIAATTTARPVRYLLAGVVPLTALALLYPLLQVSFDETRNQSRTSDSNRGYAMLAAHFPLDEVLPYYVMITADHDLRTAKGLAALEQAAALVSRQPGVVAVRGITRPLGIPLTEASIGVQAGRIGGKLAQAGGRVTEGVRKSELLDGGAARLVSGAARVAAGADRAVVGTGRLVGGLRELQQGIGALGAGAGAAARGSERLRIGADTLATALESAAAQTSVAVDGLGLAYTALTRSLGCGVDPFCRPARDGVRQVYEGERDRLLPGLRQAAQGARALADGTVSLAAGTARIDAGLDRAQAGNAQILDGQRLLHRRLGDLAAGADQVATGAGAIQGGTAQTTRSLDELEAGLGQAARYLRAAGDVSKNPGLGGFFLPPSALKDPRLATAAGFFLTADGRTARFFVMSEDSAFSRTAIERSGSIREAFSAGLAGTNLSDASVELTGLAPTFADLEVASNSDFRLVVGVALLAVFLILLLLLRSIVAAVFLLATVVLSYAATIGLSVLLWQVILDKPLDWPVPMMALILLVAVGADYNLLLMKRMQEEGQDGSRAGIARAVTATGSVITTAGIIFAASMFAMMTGGILSLTQIGFTIGTGLLIDTFVVRTLIVPAGAALLGPWLWWPLKTQQDELSPAVSTSSPQVAPALAR